MSMRSNGSLFAFTQETMSQKKKSLFSYILKQKTKTESTAFVCYVLFVSILILKKNKSFFTKISHFSMSGSNIK